MSLDYEKISNAYVTINGIHLPVLKIFETVNGVWMQRYSGEVSLDQLLIDFEYTDNRDGTVTITGWKGTCNGASSTELVIPDDSRIIL